MGGCGPSSKYKTQAADAEAIALPNGQPPSAVLAFIKQQGDCLARLNREKHNHKGLRWLQRALPLQHNSTHIQSWITQLLAVKDFTINMQYTQTFVPLQTCCHAALVQLGAPLAKVYHDQQLLHHLGSFAPTLSIHPTPPAALRQDHPLIGLVPSSTMTMNMDTFMGESQYLHALRLMAYVVNEEFQTTVNTIVTPLHGDHIGCAIKSDARMRQKALASEDHRYGTKPRPALNLDVVRCCVAFGTPDALKAGVLALVDHFNTGGRGTGAGLGQVQNEFAWSEEEAAASFHVRTLHVYFRVDFGGTYGEWMARDGVRERVDHYVHALPENPEQSMFQWRRDVTAAVACLTSAELSTKPVTMVCEVQCVLRPWGVARHHMQLLSKVAKATSPEELFQEFAAVPLATHASWQLAEEDCVDVARREGKAKPYTGTGRCVGAYVQLTDTLLAVFGVSAVAQGVRSALFNACWAGWVAAVEVALAVKGVDVNQTDKDGGTPLCVRCCVLWWGWGCWLYSL
jgi:hypothetical protein